MHGQLAEGRVTVYGSLDGFFTRGGIPVRLCVACDCGREIVHEASICYLHH